MKKNTYLIGDVANLIGISRDTLRYYEKRGIITSEKAENGYRYYTEEDISKLISIIYQRKMDISLSDLETLWEQGNTAASLSQLATKRLAEERNAIRLHEQTIARLTLTQNDCQKINDHLNKVSLKDFPTAYIVVPQTTLQESVFEWFQLSKLHPGLDMLYTFDEFSYTMVNHQYELNFQNSQLLLYQTLEHCVDFDLDLEQSPKTVVKPCIYTMLEADTRKLNQQHLQPLLSWAKDQDIALSDRIYSNALLQGAKNGENFYYLELFIPLI